MDVCLEQIRRGMAWRYKQYQRDQSAADRQPYAATKVTAQANHVGLWRNGGRWRRGHLGIGGRGDTHSGRILTLDQGRPGFPAGEPRSPKWKTATKTEREDDDQDTGSST